MGLLHTLTARKGPDNPTKKDLEMKKHIIIIFSVNQLTRIKIKLCLSYKTNMENIQD